LTTILSGPRVAAAPVNDLQIPCTFGTGCAARLQADATTGQFPPEILRAIVRAALKTW